MQVEELKGRMSENEFEIEAADFLPLPVEEEKEVIAIEKDVIMAEKDHALEGDAMKEGDLPTSSHAVSEKPQK